MDQGNLDYRDKRITDLYGRVRSLQLAIYSLPDPSTADDEYRELTNAEQDLMFFERELAEARSSSKGDNRPAETAHGRLLGPKTTGLSVETRIGMHPIPTGIYNLLDPEVDPLLTVKVANVSRDPRRVCVKAFIEGLSAATVRTVELDPRNQVILKLLPTLLPERARELNEIQRATLHVSTEDLDGKPESYETFSIVCLSRNSSFNVVRDPTTHELKDLSHYYAAWVTPYSEEVQMVIRSAADLIPERQFWGYQGPMDPEIVDKQVRGLYESLKQKGVVYINSIIDYGAAPGQFTQRTRLPRESLRGRAANCIDGTVLFASLLEGVSLNAALVLVPGHAFVGWETWNGSDDWHFLETTMIGTHDFESACASGRKQFSQAINSKRMQLILHQLNNLRARGIWPME